MNLSQLENGVFFNEEGYRQLNLFLAEKNFSKIFILVDQNTHLHCLSSFLPKLETSIPIEVLEMEAGEANKTIETCNGIWQVLSELGADRKSVMINLGGGVVTDLGGFVAATFKRGISCIHFPTTLLGMVDAAIGGKNGVNLDGLKNQIGVIRPPEMVVLDTSFLQTLPAAEMRSGLAEMLKHGLIQNEDYWDRLSDLSNLDLSDLDSLIEESIEIKENVVQQDPTEQNLRKSLNFGHTLGHAIESYFLEASEKQKLLHGEAVAVGMVLAAYLSFRTESFPQEKLQEIKETIVSMYGQIEISREDQEKIIELLKFDKKNEAGKINFVLLRRIGEPVMDRQVTNELIYDAFSYYLDN
ncbi:3-dehydroquinate synthase [Salinimicrobium catena]|uniref:3-dehydroquinate synthase n=1 Tax=Salinimicrobium catena TaxID=390640 RepID=A0A1H5LYK3_9FLAO|nr:3-dehydroquinate synthase [Salinimicrobium catena]SDL16184.1 3-dehydroquinate synthase [Salinimicrobium catena]SEE82074.1 3-dehydroquinate synthase [Salinimicrobium catena]